MASSLVDKVVNKAILERKTRGFFGITKAERENAESMASISTDEFLLKCIDSVKKVGMPLVSKFFVGVAALAGSGNVIFGVNIEFPNLSIGHSIHAEQFMVAQLHHLKETELITLAVNAPPCGHCRQFLKELCGDQHQLRIIIGGEHGPLTTTLSALLPHSFGPNDLGKTERILKHDREQRLVLSSPIISESENLKLTADAALKGANDAHAPYSRNPEGVAVVLRTGERFVGSTLESAAYNPTLPAAQGAVIQVVAAGQDISSISAAVIVTCTTDVSRTSSTFSSAGLAEELLKSISPLLDHFEVMEAKYCICKHNE